MSILFVSVILSLVAVSHQGDTAADQLPNFRDEVKHPIGILTTSSGAPVEDGDFHTLNNNLLASEYFMDELTHLLRERIPERVVHAGGTGAFGYFETTHDISHICKAKMFQVGKKTPVAMRISLSAQRKGSQDTIRGSRGIGIKFYTEEGNMDLTAFNIPVFLFREPSLIMALSHILKTNPVTDLPDQNMFWDFITLNPETINANLYFLSDFGAPVTYRDMPIYPVHTYQVYNEKGEINFLRFNFIPVGGAKYYNETGFNTIAAGDPNFYAKDLYNSINNPNINVSWYMEVQVVTDEQRKNESMDIFDVTQVLPINKYKPQRVGTLTLNKNPSNSFAEIEQLSFLPGNVVPGVVGSPDKIYDSRRFAYRDAANYRLGTNFNRIPVNCPHSLALTYNRDGVPPLDDNGGGAPNYYPNSFNGPVTYRDSKRPQLIKIFEKPSGDSPPNFKQIDNMYTNELTKSQRQTLITNVVGSLCPAIKDIHNRALKWFHMINTDFAKNVADGLANC